MTLAADFETLGGETEVITSTEAARMLRINQAKLAELVWTGQLQQVGHRVFDRAEVRDLVARQQAKTHRNGRFAAVGRLPRIQEMTVELLADWGGSGRVPDLKIALGVRDTAHVLRPLQESGYITQTAAGNASLCTLTANGWRHVREYPRC